jgi:tRNA pseudouridine-54 N-methylase
MNDDILQNVARQVSDGTIIATLHLNSGETISTAGFKHAALITNAFVVGDHSGSSQNLYKLIDPKQIAYIDVHPVKSGSLSSGGTTAVR